MCQPAIENNDILAFKEHVEKLTGRWTIFSELSKKNLNMSSNPKLRVATQIQRWITDYGLFQSLTHLFVHPLAHTKLEKPPIRFRCRKEHMNARTPNFACGTLRSPVQCLRRQLCCGY